MTDLDTDYIRDYHFDNRGVVPDNHCHNLGRVIGIVAGCLTNLYEIVLIENVDVVRSYIDLEIDYDLVDNLGCSYPDRDYGSNYCLDSLDYWESFVLRPVGPLVA